MREKAVVPREEAERDIDQAIGHYLAEGGTGTALAFIDALERAFAHLAVNPATGSPRLTPPPADPPGAKPPPI